MELSRRKFFTGSAASAATTAFFGALDLDPAEARRSVAVPSGPASSGMDRLEGIMANNRITLLGDTDHAKDLYGFLSNPRFLDAAQKANVGTIAVEIDPSMQIYADNLAANKISRRQFVDAFNENYVTLWPNPDVFYDNIAGAVQSAHARGIKVAFVDQPSLAAFVSLENFSDKYVTEIEKINSLSGEKKKKLSGLFIRQHASELMQLDNQVTQDRISPAANSAIASLIEQSSPKGFNTVVLFGAAHDKVLQDAFQKKGITSATVALHADLQSFKDNKNTETAVDFSKISNFLIDKESFVDDSPVAASPRPTASLAKPTQAR